MPSWLSILISLVACFALSADLRRRALEDAILRPRRGCPGATAASGCRYPVSPAQLRWHVRDARRRRRLGFAESVAELRAGSAVGDVAEQLAHGRLPGPGSPFLN